MVYGHTTIDTRSFFWWVVFFFLQAAVSSQIFSSDGDWQFISFCVNEITTGLTTLLPKAKSQGKTPFFLGQGLEKIGLKVSSGPLLYSKAELLGFKLYFGIF